MLLLASFLDALALLFHFLRGDHPIASTGSACSTFHNHSTESLSPCPNAGTGHVHVCFEPVSIPGQAYRAAVADSHTDIKR